MKILVISRNAWDDTNSIGNTLSNFFFGMDDVEFAHIYFRSSTPANNMCKTYYRTTEIEVLKKWFFPRKIGKKIILDNFAGVEESKASKKEKSAVRFIQKHKLNLAYKISDFIWYKEKWINENLEKFVEDFSPNLMVTFVKSDPQYFLTVKYLRKRFNIPLFTWIADDEYTGLWNSKSEKRINNLKYILSESTVVTGCSEEICDYYNSIFGCNATPLYKSCDLTTPVKSSINHPITMVYAGNLLYGRMKIIEQISEAVASITSNGKEMLFEIYSNTSLSDDEIQTHFGNYPMVKYMGKKSYDFIKERLSDADIVLHVESFDEDQILKTKYSFSTKIIDYLQCGSVLMAVGPNNIASMRYVNQIPGACTVNDIESFSGVLCELMENKEHFEERAMKTREFAKKYHDNRVASTKLREMFEKIVIGGV